MMVNEDWRSRAMGVAAAIGLLVAGVIANQVDASGPEVKSNSTAVMSPTLGGPKIPDCSLAARSEQTVPFC